MATLFAEGWATRREYPTEDFFGVGPDSLREDHVSFALRERYSAARGGVRPVRPRSRRRPRATTSSQSSGRGQDSRIPSIEALFDETTAPGLDPATDYLVASTLRRGGLPAAACNARRGGWYRIEFSRHDDRDLDAYSFNRVDVDLRQYVPFLAERRVIAVRAYVSTSDADAGQTMPFYLMPYLGGRDTLRGFREYRFRGPHACCCRRNTGTKSGRASTARSSTTRARSRSSGRIST